MTAREISEKLGFPYPQEPASSIYLNRYCPFRCAYCGIRIEGAPEEGELSLEEWKKVFEILRDVFEIKFHLILGTEVLALGKKLVDLVVWLQENDFYLNMYTTFPRKYDWVYEELIKIPIYGISAGFDVWPDRAMELETFRKLVEGGTYAKAKRVKDKLFKAKENGVKETYGNITIGKYNLDHVVIQAEFLGYYGIYTGWNIMHWGKGPLYDFMAPGAKEYAISEQDVPKLREVLKALRQSITEGKTLVQLPFSWFEGIEEFGLELNYQFKYGMIAVDSNGTMRTCAYRLLPGEPLTIFEMEDPKKLEQFLIRWNETKKTCPGCYWSYPYLIDYQDYGDFYVYLDKVRKARRDGKLT